MYVVDKRFNFHLKLISYLVWEMENGLLLLDRQQKPIVLMRALRLCVGGLVFSVRI